MSRTIQIGDEEIEWNRAVSITEYMLKQIVTDCQYEIDEYDDKDFVPIYEVENYMKLRKCQRIMEKALEFFGD